MRGLLLVLFVSLLLSPHSVIAQNGPLFTLYNFCYWTQNTLSTSPHLPWGMQMSGTLNLTTFAPYLGIYGGSGSFGTIAPGYPVTNAIGTRVVYQGGNAAATSNIVGIAPLLSYNGNDNIISTTPPYLDNSIHSLTFVMSSQPVFAMGSVSYNPSWVNVNNNTYPLAGGAGLQESDNPINDGNADVVSSYFYLAPTTTWSSTFACPNPLLAITVPSAAVTQFNQQTRVVSFCYSFTGGPGYYFDNAGNGNTWTITTSGNITTTNYAGMGVDGRTAYMVTGLTGTRTYVDNFGVTITSQITGITGVDAQNAQSGSLATGDYLTQGEQVTNGKSQLYQLTNDISNNVMYTTWPYFDSYGVNLVTAYATADQYQYNLSTSIVRVFCYTTPAENLPSDGDLGEWALDLVAGYYYFSYTGAMVASTTSAISGSVCSPTAGPSQQLNFCYFVDGTASSPPYFSYAYGQLTASGPVSRNGRMAYTMQTMTGIRSYTDVNSGNVSNSNIIGLNYINSDLGSRGFISDNLLYTSAPFLSPNGFIMTTGNFATFPSGQVTPLGSDSIGTTGILDINVYIGGQYPGFVGNAFSEASVYNYYNLNSPWVTYSTVANFSYAPYSATAIPTSLCQSTSKYIVPAAYITYSFCYLVQGGDNGGWQTATQGTLTTWAAPIISSQTIQLGTNILGGQTAYAVVGATGTRTYKDNLGNNSVATITGVANNNQGGYGWYYDNLLYKSYPYLDADGLLLTFSGTAVTVDGPITGDNTLVFNFFWWYQYQEEAYDAGTFNIIGSQDAIGQTLGLVQDSGASASTILQGTCGYNPTATFQNQYQYIPFCYTTTNTLTTSPYLGWSVQMTGTLKVISNSMTTGWQGQFAEPPGFLVVDARGTRTIYQGGNAAVTSQITGVAAPNTYNGNDNIIDNITSSGPFLDANAPHSISFIMSAAPIFAAGTVPGNTQYVNVNGFTTTATCPSPFPVYYCNPGTFTSIMESDNPAYDNETTVITSFFALGTPTSSLVSSWAQCPYTISQPVLPNGVTAATMQATTQVPFCYTFAGIDPYGHTWSLQASGLLTLAGYMGTTFSGRPAYLVVGASGIRSLTSYVGNSSTNITGVGGVNAVPDDAFTVNGNWGPNADAGFNAYWYADNVYYPSYPYFDVYGVNLISTQPFYNLQWPPYGSYAIFTGSNSAIKIFNDPYTYQFSEWLLDLNTGYYYVNDAGTVIVTSLNGATANGQSLSAFYGQCSPNAGPLQTFSFCYYIDGTNQSPPFFTFSYGQFTATGPVTRQGRSAYTMQSMMGTRTFNLWPGYANATQTNVNIIGLQYLTYDEGYTSNVGGLNFWTLNDNLVYVPGSGPVIDSTGFIYTTGQGAQFPMINVSSNTAYTQDISVYVSQPGNGTAVSLVEYAVGSDDFGAQIQDRALSQSRWGFNYSPYVAGQQPTCNAGALATPSGTTTWSFCYVISGTAWGSPYTVSSMGTITTQNSAITQDGQLAYGITGAAGYRQYQDSIGNNSYITITGLASNDLGGAGWLYNQALFPAFPNFDSYGLLYTYTGVAMTQNGPVVNWDGTPVINIFYQMWNGNTLLGVMGFQEEAYTQALGASYGAQAEDVAGIFQARQDGGSSYANGNILRYACNYTGSIPAGYGGSSASSGGSSGLSGGKIAGIVIGSVVGALLAIAVCVLLLSLASKGGGKSTDASTTKTRYEPHTLNEVSVNSSQVEMGPA